MSRATGGRNAGGIALARLSSAAAAVLLLLVIGGGAPARAAPPREAGDIVSGMKACLAVHKKRERLRCFEALARETIGRAEAAGQAAAESAGKAEGRPRPEEPVAGAQPPAAAPPSKAAPATSAGAQAEAADPAREDARADYGLKRKKARKEPKTLDVVIVAAWPDRGGRWRFETEDGQVWRQRDDVRVRLTRLPVKARIEKGLIGGYFLDIEGVPSDIRVERLR